MDKLYCSVCHSEMLTVYKNRRRIPWCPNWKSHQGQKARAVAAAVGREVNVHDKPIDVAKIQFSDQQMVAIRGAEQIARETAGPEEDRVTLGIRMTARAGCGKTTCIRGAAFAAVRVNPRIRSVYLTFSREEVNKAKPLMPPMDVESLHSFGLRAIKAAYPNARVEGGDKIRKIIAELVPISDNDEPEEKAEALSLRKVVSKLTDLVANHAMRAPLNVHELEELCYLHNIDPVIYNVEMLKTLIEQILTRSLSTLNESIGFLDMIYAPIFDRQTVYAMLRERAYDLVFVDEQQDNSKIQHLLVLLAVGVVADEAAITVGAKSRFMARAPGAIIFIGDDRQTIYGFRGAMQDGMQSFTEMIESYGDVVYAPLTVSRRIPQLVAKLAQMDVPDIQAHPNNPEGFVRLTDTRTFHKFIGPDGRDDVWVLARTNAPLAKHAIKLVKKGIPVNINAALWESIQRDARRFASKADRNELDYRSDPSGFAEYTRAKLNETLERMTPKNRHQLEPIVDRLEVELVMAEESGELWIEFFRLGAKLFTEMRPDDGKTPVKFATIHKSKGGEADCIFVVGGSNIPHSRAKQEWELLQEANMRYVMITRAKKGIAFIDELPDLYRDLDFIEEWYEPDEDGIRSEMRNAVNYSDEEE